MHQKKEGGDIENFNDDERNDPIDFVNRFLQGQLTKDEARYIGFREQTHRPELIERTVLEVAGTVLACQLACKYGIASNVAGGTHHAHPMGGAGYTVLNDLAVTATFLTTPDLHQGSIPPGIQTVLVVDCDVHQGDGTAKYSNLWKKKRENEEQKPPMVTLSLHCASNYPQYKANSTYDIGLRDGCDDEEHITLLQSAVIQACQETQPDLYCTMRESMCTRRIDWDESTYLKKESVVGIDGFWNTVCHN